GVDGRADRGGEAEDLVDRERGGDGGAEAGDPDGPGGVPRRGGRVRDEADTADGRPGRGVRGADGVQRGRGRGRAGEREPGAARGGDEVRLGGGGRAAAADLPGGGCAAAHGLRAGREVPG